MKFGFMSPSNAPDWVEQGLNHLWLPYTQMKTAPTPTAVAATKGCHIVLEDGRQLIDGCSSWWTACHGYNHPHIVAEVGAQLQKMPHIMMGGLANEQARWNALAGNTVITVTAGNIIACHFAGAAILNIGQARVITIEIMDRHILGLINQIAAHGSAGIHQILGHFGLTINRYGFATGSVLQIDAVAAPGKTNFDAIMYQSLAPHAIARLRHARAKLTGIVLNDVIPQGQEYSYTSYHDRPARKRGAFGLLQDRFKRGRRQAG